MAKVKLSKLQQAYREFFKAMMDDFGVKSPAELGNKRTEFFNRVKKEWPAAKRKIKEGVFRQEIRSMIVEVLSEAKYDLGFGSLGNGLTVYNKAKEEHGDYQKVAHIGRDRKITYYIKNLPSNVKQEIEKVAKGKNMQTSASQEWMKVFNEAKEAPEHFKKLAKIIIDKKGNFSAKDFEKLGIPFEIFLQMAQVNKNTLVKNAKKMLSQQEIKTFNEAKGDKYPPGNHYSKAHDDLDSAEYSLLAKENGLMVAHSSITKKMAKKLKQKNTETMKLKGRKDIGFVVPYNEYEKIRKENQKEIDNYIKMKKLYNEMEGDEIPGGKGDTTNPQDVDQNELKVGIKVEREHTDSDKEAEEIALDHLTENPKYYSNLIKSGIVDEKPALELAKKYGMIETIQIKNLRNIIREEVKKII